MSSQDRRRLLGYAILAIVLSGMFVVGFVVSRPVQIAWHQWRMDAARRAHYSQPRGTGYGLDVGKDWSDFEKHRDALVRLGIAAELHYKFRHIMAPTNESKHFVSESFESSPASIHWGAEAPYSPEPLTMTVWCWTEHASAWDEWVGARDVPDYRERFMEESE